jgi:NTP pyrophosphatase (non-canonical NTP hydrolase)
VSDDLTLREMQSQVDRWVRRYAIGYWEPLAMLARLVEEVGEMARLLNHLYGPKQKRSDEPGQELALELGDLLYTITCMANAHGVDLQEAFEAVMRKLDARDRGRYVSPSED